ncbi:16S rRNA (cytosine(1402)-N(4))-methyltransferase RsmH [Candidatus Gribaldobacteria bacterium]|nr:16S rRNA (cytosine(1402)-N(4))-methyltransferase RsmH [Candidatus Gribaldobacteria bacterium]
MHIPVLKDEVLRALNLKANGKYLDATLGFAGHSLAILDETEKMGKRGEVLGIEKDEEACSFVKAFISENKIRGLTVINDSYIHLKEVAEKQWFKEVDGVLFDLGLSSWQLEKSNRGFTFQKNEPLDIRYSIKDKEGLTAEKILATWPEKDLIKMLKRNSQEKFAKPIAKEIVATRNIKPLKTTFDLTEVIQRALTKAPYQQKLKSKIHPATRTFQALRIEVNQEFASLKQGLEKSLDILNKNGRLAIISFHSLEEKIIKNFFKNKRKEKKLKIITLKPITPSKAELSQNKRARSAKLWVAEKI